MISLTKRSPKLATKLLVALLVPLLAVGVLAAILVDAFSKDAQQADSELNDVRVAIALSELGVAIRDELSAMAFLPLFDATTDLNQALTDEAFAEALEVAGSEVTIIRTYRGRIEKSRETIGNVPTAIRTLLAAEVLSGRTDGQVSQQVALYREASAAFLQAATFESPEELSGQAAASLASVQLISNYNSAIQAEYDAFQAFRAINAATVDRQVQTLASDIRLASATSEAAQAAIFAIGAPELKTELSNLRNTQAFTETLELRALVTADLSGNAPSTRSLRLRAGEISTNRLTSSIWALSSSLDIIRFQAITELEEGAESRRDSARLALRSTASFAGLLSLLVLALGFYLYRSIRRPIRNLTRQSRRIANHDLPEVVTLMREQGTDAELPTIEPIESEANDEIGALVHAFNQMHSTAVQLAAEQAVARATVADMFVNLGRRNQKLLLRVLNHMDSLERKATNADVLEELYKVDHLATRMRRNAESLLVLAGARSTRHFNRPLPLSALLRASLSEVDGYERVHLNIADDVLIDASAIADISHLVAELVENAITFSPKSSRVEIAARRGDNSLLLAIADQGKGMTPEELEAANQRIAEAAQNTETPSRFLGHYVSGRLAARHDLELLLIPGMPSGLICRIRIPGKLLITEPSDRPKIDGPLSAQVASHARTEQIEGKRKADLNESPFVEPGVAAIPAAIGAPDTAIDGVLSEPAIQPAVAAAPIAPAVEAVAQAPVAQAPVAEAEQVAPAVAPVHVAEVETPSHASFAGAQAASADWNPPKPQHRVNSAATEEVVAEVKPAPAAPVTSILPGSAPETVTTEGPTQGALAGSRRRVPTSERSAAEAPAPVETPAAAPAAAAQPPAAAPAPSVAAPAAAEPVVPDPVPAQGPGGLVTSGRRTPGANMPKGLEPRVIAKSESERAQSMDEALTLTRSADAVKASFGDLQSAFSGKRHNSPEEKLEDLTENAEGTL